MAPDPIRLQLELQRDGDPIEGRLRSGHGKPVPFIGWLELIAALEMARAEKGRVGGPPRNRSKGRPS